jgi:hypothetical protein
MPCPFDQFQVLFNHPIQLAQRACIEPFASRDPHCRAEPELGLSAIASHMNMRRLTRVSFIRIEEEAESFVAENGRLFANDRPRRVGA